MTIQHHLTPYRSDTGVSRAVWPPLTPVRNPVLDEAFLSFMEKWGGYGFFDDWATVQGSGLDVFLGAGADFDSVTWEHNMLDPDLRHYLPFARNNDGGRFLLDSESGHIYYANLEGVSEDLEGEVAQSFSEFLEMIDLEPTDG